MGETRSPVLGQWTVFEGDEPVCSLIESIRFNADVNRPVDWPVTFRIFYIRDGVMSSRDIVVDEQLEVEVGVLEVGSLRDDESRLLPGEAASPHKEREH